MPTSRNKQHTEQISGVYFKTLDAFFNGSGGFNESRSTLKRLFIYAFSEDSVPAKEEILKFRSFQSVFNKLLEATYELPIASFIGTPSLHSEVFTRSNAPKPESYLDIFADPKPSSWDHYPHFLSRYEFINPFFVFKKCFLYLDLLGWKAILDEVIHATLLHQSIIDFSDSINNVIILHDFLFKFLEASHLIRVRQSNRL